MAGSTKPFSEPMAAWSFSLSHAEAPSAAIPVRIEGPSIRPARLESRVRAPGVRAPDVRAPANDADLLSSHHSCKGARTERAMGRLTSAVPPSQQQLQGKANRTQGSQSFRPQGSQSFRPENPAGVAAVATLSAL